MGATCDSTADRLASSLGFSCRHANPFVTLRNPVDLANWTLPVLELTIVLGAILALVHAIRRLRRDGDPTNLALWIAAVVYLLVIEPPLYFPGWFGLQKPIGFMFSHNVFTVQFMYDRLPLYIVAFYPALSQVAYEIVRVLGVFARRGPLAGAVCVAFVYQVFYEIFDQLGPQLKWWAWNLDNPENHPLLASVPLNSVWLFAAVSFGVLTYLIARLVGRPSWNGRPPHGWSLVWRTVVAGVLAPLGMVIGSIPTAIFGGAHPNVTAQAVVFTIEITALWLLGAAVLIQQWRRDHRPATVVARPRSRGFLLVFPAIYLGVMAVLWIGALPDLLRATHGHTTSGTPIGSLPYAVACYLAAAVSLIAAIATSRRAATETSTRAARKATVPEHPGMTESST